MKKTLEFIGEQHKVTDLLHYHNAISVAVYGDEKTALTLPVGLQQAYTLGSDVKIYEFTTEDESTMYSVNMLYATDELMTEDDLLNWMEEYACDPWGETVYFPNDDIVKDFFGSNQPMCITETDLYEQAKARSLDYDELEKHFHEATSEDLRNHELYIP